MSKGLHRDDARNDFKASNSIDIISWDVLPWYVKTSVIISLFIGFVYLLAVLMGIIGALL